MGLLTSLVNPITSYYEGQRRLAGAKAGTSIANQGYDDATEMAQQAQTSAQGTWNPYSQYGAQGRGSLQSMLTDAGQFATPDFQYQGEMSDYLDPSMAFRLKTGTQAMDQSAAARGGAFDSGYGKDLQNYAQGLASEEYGNAFGRMQNDRQSQLSKYSTVLEQARANRQQRMNGLQGMVDTGTGGDTNISNANQNYFGTAQQGILNKAQNNSQLAAMRQQNKGSLGTALLKSLAGAGDAGLDMYTGGSGLASIFGSGKAPQVSRGGTLNSDGSETWNTKRIAF